MSGQIQLRFFAGLREQLNCAEESIAVPAGVTTVGALREHLAARGGAWSEALAARRLVRIARNHQMVPATEPFDSGDEIAFFPPVTGG